MFFSYEKAQLTTFKPRKTDRFHEFKQKEINKGENPKQLGPYVHMALGLSEEVVLWKVSLDLIE